MLAACAGAAAGTSGSTIATSSERTVGSTLPSIAEPSITAEAAPTSVLPITAATEPEPSISTTEPDVTSPVTVTFNGAGFDAVMKAVTVDRGDLATGVAVVRDGVVVHAAAYGTENPATGTATTTATRFRIASISKMFTAVAVMQLVDEGLIKLDEPFAAQLGLPGPFADPRIGFVTVRQLLSHTSGFRASKNLFFGRGVESWQQAALLGFAQSLQSEPGTDFQYSNMNYCLLGVLLEHVTGEPFESVIRERVLRPAGIDAHLAPTFDAAPGDAVHLSAEGRNYMETLGPAGGWVARPADVAVLAAALRFDSAGSHLLDASTVATMRTPMAVLAPADDWTYGLGLRLFADGSWGHTGSIESTHSVVVNRPDGFTVAVLVSGKSPGDTDDLLAFIDRAIAGGIAP